MSLIPLTALGQGYAIRPVAGGGGGLGYPNVGDGGAAVGAYLLGPRALAMDSMQNIYIADSGDSVIRQVTPQGIIYTVAGSYSVGFAGDGGLATKAKLDQPLGVAVDPAGNLYISDTGNNRIRKVSGVNGTISTVAGTGAAGYSGDGGPATSAKLNSPAGLALDTAGNLYIADAYNHAIRKLSVDGTITTVAGTGVGGNPTQTEGDGGPATKANLLYPNDVAVDSAGNIYIADTDDSKIRLVSTSGIISTIAGTGSSGSALGDGGPAVKADLYYPGGVAVDGSGNVFITDTQHSLVRMVNAGGTISTIAGGGTVSLNTVGPATNAALYRPEAIILGQAGTLYISDVSSANLVMSLSLGPGPPAISPSGIGPVFSKATTIQPGSWVSIYGTDLATTTATWTGNFPTSLGNTTVTIDSKPAYLWFVSPTQINLQAPDDMAIGTTVNVVVTTPGGSTTSTVKLAEFSPSFSLLDSKHVAGIILRTDGSGAYGGGTYDILGPTGVSLGYKTVAAKAGDTVELFGVGFGPTNPTVLAGQAYNGAAQTTNVVSVSINGMSVPPAFAGLTSAGLYQINLVQIPAGLGSGDLPLSATVGNVQTPSGVVISMQ